MQQSPSWEANRFSASQEFPRILCNTEGSLPHSQVPANCPYPKPSRSSPYSHILLPEDPSWYYPPIYACFSQGLPSGCLIKSLYTPLLSPIHATCPTHLILLDFITRTVLGEQYRSFSSSLCNLLRSPVTLSLLGPNILLSTLLSNTLSLRLISLSHCFGRTKVSVQVRALYPF